MKHILILCALAFASCIGAKTAPISTASIEIKGEPLPAIRHMIDMKMSGDTLLFVFEGNDGYGQRFLRRAVVDTLRNTFCKFRYGTAGKRLLYVVYAVSIYC